jgi:hypothetical protein
MTTNLDGTEINPMLPTPKVMTRGNLRYFRDNPGELRGYDDDNQGLYDLIKPVQTGVLGGLSLMVTGERGGSPRRFPADARRDEWEVWFRPDGMNAKFLNWAPNEKAAKRVAEQHHNSIKRR